MGKSNMESMAVRNRDWDHGKETWQKSGYGKSSGGSVGEAGGIVLMWEWDALAMVS